MIGTRWMEVTELIGSNAPVETRPVGSGLDDQSLIARILEGSDRHFRLLIERHQSHVFQLVSSVLGPEHSSRVEEVCQDAFIKIHRSLPRFRGESGFGTWAYRVAYNTALDHLRALARRPKTVPLDRTYEARPSPQAGPAALTAGDDEAARTRQAIDQLPDIYRTLIHLHYWKGLTVNEICQVLQSSPGTVKSYLHRARARLQSALTDGDRP